MKWLESGSRIAVRAVAMAVGYVLVTGGLLATLLFELRTEALDSARKELAAYAQLTAGHTSEIVLGAEEALELAAMTLSVATGSGKSDAGQIRSMLHDVARNARVLKSVVVLDGRGHVTYQADGDDQIGKDWSAQPYFSRFERDPALNFTVTAATSETTGSTEAWFVPIAQAWRNNGSFAGLVVGFVDPRYFRKAWAFDSESAVTPPP